MPRQGFGLALPRLSMQAAGGVPGVYSETFPHTSGVGISANYGPQAGGIARVDPSDGEMDRATYVDVYDGASNDHSGFFRDVLYHNGLVFGAHAKSAAVSALEVRIDVMSADLSTRHSTYGLGNTGTPATTGNPALVASGSNLWCILNTRTAIDATGSSGGADATFSGGTFGRLAVCKFLIEDDNTLTLLNHTYIQSSNAGSTGAIACETHGIALMSDGRILVGAEANNACDLTATGDAYDGTPPASGGRKGIAVILSEDLGTVEYLSYFGANAGSSDAFFDGCYGGPDGEYGFAIIAEQDDVPTTDGSSHSLPGTKAAAFAVFNRWHELIDCRYIWQPVSGRTAEARRLIFDDSGNFYVSGWEAIASNWNQAAIAKYATTAPANRSFTRTSSADTQLAGGPNVSALPFAITDELTIEMRGVFEVGATGTMIEQASVNLKGRIVNTGTVSIRMDTTPSVQSGTTPIDDGLVHTIRWMWRGADGECKCYVDGVEEIHVTGKSTSWTVDQGAPILLCQGNGQDIDIEYIKIWGEAPSDWSQPTSDPDYVIDQSNCNVTPWKSGTVDFTASDVYSAAWSDSLAASGSNPAGQFRDIKVDDALNVYVTGGWRDGNETTDNSYTNAGGTPGSDPPYDQVVVKYNSSGTRQWLTEIGGANCYDRCYAIQLNSTASPTAIYVAGRAGDTYPAGVQ